jgi:hypothetical protein
MRRTATRINLPGGGKPAAGIEIESGGGPRGRERNVERRHDRTLYSQPEKSERFLAIESEGCDQTAWTTCAAYAQRPSLACR